MFSIFQLLARFELSRILGGMTEKQFEQYMDLCRRMFERMERDNSWPWLDSPESEDVVESEDNQHDV